MSVFLKKKKKKNTLRACNFQKSKSGDNFVRSNLHLNAMTLNSLSWMAVNSY